MVFWGSVGVGFRQDLRVGRARGWVRADGQVSPSFVIFCPRNIFSSEKCLPQCFSVWARAYWIINLTYLFIVSGRSKQDRNLRRLKIIASETYPTIIRGAIRSRQLGVIITSIHGTLVLVILKNIKDHTVMSSEERNSTLEWIQTIFSIAT